MTLDLQRNGIRRFVSQSAREEEVQSRLSPPTSSAGKVARKERLIFVFSPLVRRLLFIYVFILRIVGIDSLYCLPLKFSERGAKLKGSSPGDQSCQ